MLVLAKLNQMDLIQLSQHLFKKGIPLITPLIKTSYDAFLTLHRSQDMMSRFFILSVIGRTLTICTLEWSIVVCKEGPTVVIMLLDAYYQAKGNLYILYMIYTGRQRSLSLDDGFRFVSTKHFIIIVDWPELLCTFPLSYTNALGISRKL